jgi:hypothetical protein
MAVVTKAVAAAEVGGVLVATVTKVVAAKVGSSLRNKSR